MAVEPREAHHRNQHAHRSRQVPAVVMNTGHPGIDILDAGDLGLGKPDDFRSFMSEGGLLEPEVKAVFGFVLQRRFELLAVSQLHDLVAWVEPVAEHEERQHCGQHRSVLPQRSAGGRRVGLSHGDGDPLVFAAAEQQRHQ